MLARDVPKARTLVRELVEEIKIFPVDLGLPKAHLEAEITGNMTGALQLAASETKVVAGGRFRTKSYAPQRSFDYAPSGSG